MTMTHAFELVMTFIADFHFEKFFELLLNSKRVLLNLFISIRV